MKKIILDNGHGAETAGKCSPEWQHGVLFEYSFNREIVAMIKQILDASGVPCVVLVPELNDISLQQRAIRANNLHAKDRDCILVSIHANAGGGEGYEIFTSKGKTSSDDFAKIILDEVKDQFPEWKMRGVKEEDFYILKKTSCPAVLCELGFMDSEADYNRLNSDEFKNRLAIAHANALIKIARL